MDPLEVSVRLPQGGAKVLWGRGVAGWGTWLLQMESDKGLWRKRAQHCDAGSPRGGQLKGKREGSRQELGMSLRKRWRGPFQAGPG